MHTLHLIIQALDLSSQADQHSSSSSRQGALFCTQPYNPLATSIQPYIRPNKTPHPPLSHKNRLHPALSLSNPNNLTLRRLHRAPAPRPHNRTTRANPQTPDPVPPLTSSVSTTRLPPKSSPDLHPPPPSPDETISNPASHHAHPPTITLPTQHVANTLARTLAGRRDRAYAIPAHVFHFPLQRQHQYQHHHKRRSFPPRSRKSA